MNTNLRHLRVSQYVFDLFGIGRDNMPRNSIVPKAIVPKAIKKKLTKAELAAILQEILCSFGLPIVVTPGPKSIDGVARPVYHGNTGAGPGFKDPAYFSPILDSNRKVKGAEGMPCEPLMLNAPPEEEISRKFGDIHNRVTPCMTCSDECPPGGMVCWKDESDEKSVSPYGVGLLSRVKKTRTRK